MIDVSCSLALLGSLLLGAPPAATGHAPVRDPRGFQPTNRGFDHERREVMVPMRDGVRLHTVILVPRGARGAPMLLTRTPYEADKLTSHAVSAHLGPVLQGYDNVADVVVEGGLHPRGPGHPGQAPLGGGLRDDAAAAGPAEPHRGRPRHRRLRHHRLAGEERPRVQRAGGHPRHLLRRLPPADGARRPAPGAQGGGADESDGGRMEGRRLVPQRRLPAASTFRTSTTRRPPGSRR